MLQFFERVPPTWDKGTGAPPSTRADSEPTHQQIRDSCAEIHVSGAEAEAREVLAALLQRARFGGCELLVREGARKQEAARAAQGASRLQLPCR